MVSRDLRDNYRGVFDNRLGFGTAPAVLVIDFIRAYTTPGERFYSPAVVEAVRATGAVLDLARAKGVPIIYTDVVYSQSGREGGLFVVKIPGLRALVRGAEAAQIVPELAPTADDVVITKQYASGFFGTSLASLLTSSGIDTIILTGCSTSGCVRATAVDGIQYGFRVVVPRECVGDRAVEPHEANLFDIDSKYGDVVARAEVLAYLEGLS